MLFRDNIRIYGSKTAWPKNLLVYEVASGVFGFGFLRRPTSCVHALVPPATIAHPLEDTENLSVPEVMVQEIVELLEAALASVWRNSSAYCAVF